MANTQCDMWCGHDNTLRDSCWRDPSTAMKDIWIICCVTKPIQHFRDTFHEVPQRRCCGVLRGCVSHRRSQRTVQQHIPGRSPWARRHFVPGERPFPSGDNFQLSVGVLVDVDVVLDDRRHAHGEKGFRHEVSVDQLLHSLSERCHSVLLQLVPVALTKV